MAQFEGYERREAKILETLKKYGIKSIDEINGTISEKRDEHRQFLGKKCGELLRSL